jgi:hypothetical protein
MGLDNNRSAGYVTWNSEFQMTPLLGMSIFVRTVESGSFSAAAGLLGLSPQMAGRHIRLSVAARIRV